QAGASTDTFLLRRAQYYGFDISGFRTGSQEQSQALCSLTSASSSLSSEVGSLVKRSPLSPCDDPSVVAHSGVVRPPKPSEQIIAFFESVRIGKRRYAREVRYTQANLLPFER